MYKVKLMNKISSVGLDYFNEDYEYGKYYKNNDRFRGEPVRMVCENYRRILCQVGARDSAFSVRAY